MPLTEPNPMLMILRLCAAAAPNPWYPSAWVRAQGVSRDEIDPFLDQLRMGGLIHLTDWVPGNGQGYALTAEGAQALERPRDLERFLAGKRPAPAPERGPEASQPLTTFERGELVRRMLTTPQAPVVTRALIGLNVAVFLWGCLLAVQRGVSLSGFALSGLQGRLVAGVGQVLLDTGAAWGVAVLQEHQWWRLLTCCFVHGGLLHLGVNMYMLHVFGPLLERMWGRGRYLFLYLVAGFGGSCAVVYRSPETLLVGASGALWGLMASLVAWIVLNRNYLPRPLVSTWLRQLVGLIVLNVFISYLPGISATAHFAGGAIGLVTSVLLQFQRFGPLWQRFLAGLALLAVPVLCLAPLVRDREAAPHRGLMQDGANGGPVQRVLNVTALSEVENEIWQFYQEQVGPLLKQGPQDRDAAGVEETIDNLKLVRKRSAEIVEQLRQLGTQTDAQREAVRQAGLKLLPAESRLLEIAGRCLSRKADSTDDEYDRQRQDTAELRRQWLRVLRGAD
jgi:membrane associated rhomboid family serine protease